MSLKKEIQASVRRTQFKRSTYMSIFVVAVIAIVILVNVLVNALSDSWTELDISENKIFAIGETTENMLDSLEKDVELIVIAEDGTVDPRIVHFLEIYDNASGHITVSYVDPALYPSILTTYDTEENTIVVKCEETEKTETIAFTDIIQFDQTYYYYYGSYVETAWDGEGQLTTAIDYVSGDNTETVYQLGGHGETTLGDTITESIARSNITVSTWTLLTDGDLPEDCSTIVINQPTSDISENELNSLQEFLAAGGNILLILGEKDIDCPNLDTLMASYGIADTEGYVGDQQRYNSYERSAFSSFPDYSSGAITGNLNSDSDLTLVNDSRGLTVTAVDGVTVDEFFVTSSAGIYYVDENNYETGVYTYAATATKEEEADADGNAVTSSLTVYACSDIVDETLLSMYNGLANTTVFVNSITAYYEDVNNISIETVSLETSYNTITGAQPIFALIVVAVIAMIVIGIVHWVKRRRL